MSQRNAISVIGIAAMVTSLACAANSSRDDAAGYQGMSRDTTVRDTTVLRDTMMVRDTAAGRDGDTERGGDTTFVQGRDTSSMQSSTDTNSTRSRTDTSAVRPSTSIGSPQR